MIELALIILAGWVLFLIGGYIFSFFTLLFLGEFDENQEKKKVKKIKN